MLHEEVFLVHKDSALAFYKTVAAEMEKAVPALAEFRKSAETFFSVSNVWRTRARYAFSESDALTQRSYWVQKISVAHLVQAINGPALNAEPILLRAQQAFSRENHYACTNVVSSPEQVTFLDVLCAAHFIQHITATFEQAEKARTSALTEMLGPSLSEREEQSRSALLRAKENYLRMRFDARRIEATSVLGNESRALELPSTPRALAADLSGQLIRPEHAHHLREQCYYAVDGSFARCTLEERITGVSVWAQLKNSWLLIGPEPKQSYRISIPAPLLLRLVVGIYDNEYTVDHSTGGECYKPFGAEKKANE